MWENKPPKKQDLTFAISTGDTNFHLFCAFHIIFRVEPKVEIFIEVTPKSNTSHLPFAKFLPTSTPSNT